VGYGFPNLDKNELPEFYEAYKGTASQNGPITGAIDYQFSRRASIGVLATHGEVKVPYYDYNNSAIRAMTGSLDNWSFMLNMMHYLSAGKTVTPYIRTAIGINAWKQEFKDASGNKINEPVFASDFAYQAGLGAKFALSKNASLFAEAGYGKYIVQGGISLKF
jgi:opacity protein-like surface antigen